MTGVVIIGAGQAGATFAAKFRSIDKNTPVTLIGEEPDFPYQRPPLSKKYALGEMSKEQLYLRSSAWYEKENVTLIRSVKAIKVDRQAKTIALSDRSTLSYSTLVFATGSRARKLPDTVTQGLGNIFYVRSLADADAFGAALNKHRKVLIVGGGYIGLEAAAVCRSKGMEVTLIEASDRILQRVACEETSTWFRQLHESEGVEIIEGVGLSQVEGTGVIERAVLDNGRTIETDMLIVGIGIIPNTELAADCGIEIDNGICVDAQCRTSDANIYAAGDCAVFEFDGQPTRLESVQNALDQSTVAALNIANDDQQAYVPKPWFWSDQYDVKLQIAGLNRGYQQVIVRPGDTPRSISHFHYKNDKLIAIDAMNSARVYMVGKRLIEAGKQISPTQAADTTLDLKSLL